MSAKWQAFPSFTKKQEFLTLFQPKKVHSILIEANLYHEFHHRYLGENYAVLSTENTFLPYLSLQENIFINSQLKEKEQKQQLRQLFSLVQLNPALLNKEITTLTFFEKIKCQLLQLYLSNKQMILVTDIFRKLTVSQKQELLPLFQQIAQKSNKQIVILTTEAAIADNIYVDIKLSAATDFPFTFDK